MAPVPRPARGSHAFALAMLLCSVLAACSSDPTETSLSSDFPREDSIRRLPGSGSFFVDPGSASVLSSQPIQFRARTVSLAGDTTTVQVNWSASGGTITSDGLFTSSATGTFSIIGRGRGRNKFADTSTVVVAGTSLPGPVRLQISPISATVTVGANRAFAATEILTDSSVTSVNVAWSATGGSIDASGIYTAGQTPGVYQVVGSTGSSGLADTVSITVSAVQPTLQAVVLSPTSASLQTGATKAFTAAGRLTDSSTVPIPVRYSATGGTITTSGSYTAGATPGTYRVIATDTSGTLADTAVVTIVAPAPTLTAVVLTPATVTLAEQSSQQFAASGKYSDGSTGPVTVTYGATGGTISSAGRYTAGQTAGTYRVIATQSGGTLADTAQVTITAPSPTSSTACSGIAVAAGSSIQNAVNANGTGAVFCLGAGTFAQQTVQPKAGQQFVGARGSGGERLSVLDGQGATYAFVGSAANVVIQGLVVKNYSPTLSDGAIFGYGGTGWRVIDNEITGNAPGGGTSLWSGWIIRRNWIHHNGETGVVGQADAVGAVVDSNEISYNNLAGGKANEGTTGGLKAIRQTNLVIRGNFVHHNVNKGLWCDYCGTGNIIRGNRVEDNTGIGIYVEVSHATTVDNNTVLRNGSSGRGGIWIDNSDHVDLSYNTVRGPSPEGLILIRMVPHSVSASDRNLNNVYVHDNRVTAGTGEYLGCVQFVSNSSYCSGSKANRFDRNAYTQPSSTAANFRWNANNSITRSVWRASGQDPNGSFAP